MGETLFSKLLGAHFLGGSDRQGAEALVRADQVLLGDGAASLAFLALEGFGIERVRCPLAVLYIDQATISVDGKVADDHAYLLAASRRLGVLFSPVGHGVGSSLHLERFARPGQVVVGAHPTIATLGAAGALAISMGGLDAALVLAGEPCAMTVPPVWRVVIHGALAAWVSATDLALELLRRHGLTARAGHVLEVTGPGVASLSIEERALFCAMASELGVVATLFPADVVLARYLEAQGRGDEYTFSAADDDAEVAATDEINLSTIEPLLAKPQSPANVVPVRFAEATPIGQVVIGGGVMAGARDVARVASTLTGRSVYAGVAFDFNPSTRGELVELASCGVLATFLEAGVRVHGPGLHGAVGVGQAPPGGRPSLRTAPQNFPGASGTKDNRVFLCSAATAAVSAVRGVISRPSELGVDPVALGAESSPRLLESPGSPRRGFIEPLPPAPPPEPENGKSRPPPAPVSRASTVRALPPLDMLPKRGEMRVILKVPDDVPAHEIVPEGLRGLSLGSNVVALGDLAFESVDMTYVKRAKVARDQDGHVIVAGHRFGYGATREHAALALRQLGLRVVIAKSFGRGFRRHLINAGVLPLTFADDGDYFPIESGELLVFDDLRALLASGPELAVRRKAKATFLTKSGLTSRELAVVVAGGVPNWFQKSVAPSSPPSRGASRPPVAAS